MYSRRTESVKGKKMNKESVRDFFNLQQKAEQMAIEAISHGLKVEGWEERWRTTRLSALLGEVDGIKVYFNTYTLVRHPVFESETLEYSADDWFFEVAIGHLDDFKGNLELVNLESFEVPLYDEWGEEQVKQTAEVCFC
jgi:hypothetical protein